MNKQIKTSIGVSVLVIIAIVAGVFMWMKSKDAGVVGNANIDYPQKPKVEQKACTEEAKICPDGSAVGRTEPNCEFAACPESNVGIANPASVNCKQKGGTSEIRTGSDGGRLVIANLAMGASVKNGNFSVENARLVEA